MIAPFQLPDICTRVHVILKNVFKRRNTKQLQGEHSRQSTGKVSHLLRENEEKLGEEKA